MAAQIAERISETFSFAKKMPMLSRATFDDDNPTPGYIYQEINSITYESINSCNSLLDYLVVRLKNKSPYVKYKVLKILCYLSANGHSEFRSGLRHKADVLREAQNFTGPIDYLKGDGPNQRVRAAASELIELLFNVESSALSNIHAMTGPTGKKMEGFGNSPLQPAKSKTWLDSVKNLAEHLPDAANRLKPKNKKENTLPAETSGTAFINYVDVASADSGFKTFLDGQVTLEPSDDEDSTDSENGLSVEAHLVNKITSEGGIRAVPSKEDLVQFTRRFPSAPQVRPQGSQHLQGVPPQISPSHRTPVYPQSPLQASPPQRIMQQQQPMRPEQQNAQIPRPSIQIRTGPPVQMQSSPHAINQQHRSPQPQQPDLARYQSVGGPPRQAIAAHPQPNYGAVSIRQPPPATGGMQPTAVQQPPPPAIVRSSPSAQVKEPPPKPSVSIAVVTSGIVLSWNMVLEEKHAPVMNYQLFALQDGGTAENPHQWKKIGVVKALPLPMACTLTQFLPGNKYHFAVRGTDEMGRLGPFSDPCTITLK